MIDLHMHSLFSTDARDEPEQLMQQAAERGASAVSVTEHNNTDSLKRAKAEAARLNMTYVHGIEIGSRLIVEGQEISKLDILGYDFKEEAPRIKALCARIEARQQWTTDAVLTGLGLLGIPITLELVNSEYPGRVSTWAIRRLLRAGGFAADKPESSRIEAEAIECTLQKHPELADRREPPVESQEAIDAIHADGGIAFMAHPFMPTKPERGGASPELVWSAIERLFEMGLDGLEAFNTSNDAGYGPEVLQYCRERGCPASGGSDSHGFAGVAATSISNELLESMRRYRAGQPPWSA